MSEQTTSRRKFIQRSLLATTGLTMNLRSGGCLERNGANVIEYLSDSGTQVSVGETTHNRIDLPLPPHAHPMRLVKIPKGHFLMGADETYSHSDDRPIHRVSISTEFLIGETLITQAHWQAVMKSLPPRLLSDNFGIGDDYPVYFVTWDDVAGPGGFIEKLNALVPGFAFRLPTEAEWEYACRAETRSTFFFGDMPDEYDPKSCIDIHAESMPGNWSDYMWYCANNGAPQHPIKKSSSIGIELDKFSGSKTSSHDRIVHARFFYGSKPVAQLRPNPYGLFDMHGNVFEWCQDWFMTDFYSQKDVRRQDPICNTPTGRRVFKGGCWEKRAWFARSGFRYGQDPTEGDYLIGFRVVAVPK